MKKYILIIGIAIVVIFIIFSLQGEKKGGEPEYLTLTLEYGDGEKQEFRTRSLEEKRAWSLLQQAASLSNIILEPTSDFRPQKINGLENGLNDKEWNLYINDVKQEESPFNIKVSPPDKVVFRFE